METNGKDQTIISIKNLPSGDIGRVRMNPMDLNSRSSCCLCALNPSRRVGLGYGTRFEIEAHLMILDFLASTQNLILQEALKTAEDNFLGVQFSSSRLLITFRGIWH